jgi:hypothetical protein
MHEEPDAMLKIHLCLVKALIVAAGALGWCFNFGAA